MGQRCPTARFETNLDGLMMKTATQPEPKQEGLTPQEVCEDLADRGDVLGLLDYLQNEANDPVLLSSLPMIGRCIREKAKRDLSASWRTPSRGYSLWHCSC